MTEINHMDSFGRRLKEERKRLGFNQTDFASQGGVQKNAQSNYESDVRQPDANYLAAIAAIGVDVAYVLTGMPSGTGLSAEERSLLNGYRGLDVRGRAGLLALLDGMQPQPTSTPATHSVTQTMGNGSRNVQVVHSTVDAATTNPVRKAKRTPAG